MNKKAIYCTVSNDISHDQRMHRICTTLAQNGYDVCLIGRQKTHSKALETRNYGQKRLNCWLEKGPLFYLELNIRLIFYLLFQKIDIIYSVDTDTLLAGTFVKILKGKKLFFDSHEYFTEVPELQDRYWVKRIWLWIEAICIPKADAAITVNESLSKILSQKYNVTFHSIYNVPLKSPTLLNKPEKPYIIYQGALNKGRCLESLISAMDYIHNIELVIAGEGDLSDYLRSLAKKGKSSDRIVFKGWQSPSQLKTLTQHATLGANLLVNTSLNYYYSLANKFFDYMHVGVPSLNMDFPEYHQILSKYDVGYTINSTEPVLLASEINKILEDTLAYEQKRRHCQLAKDVYNWENESQKLLHIIRAL
jgi:glycosyltransferase involved in cell wall biosynthesis